MLMLTNFFEWGFVLSLWEENKEWSKMSCKHEK